MNVSPKLSAPLILRNEAQPRVSQDGRERRARLARARAPFEARSGRLRAKGSALLETRKLR
jgi:hypothetical protein